MRNGQTLEVDLLLDHSEEGPICQVRQSPGGEGESRFESPFSPRELQEFWRMLSEVQDAGEATGPQRVMAQDAGKRLFQAAFAGEVLGCLRVGFDYAHIQDADLRIHIDLSHAPEYEDLPWEFLYHAEHLEFMGLNEQTPLARYTSLQHQILPVKAPKPLRALVVIPGPASYPRIDVDREWLALLDTIDFLGAEGKLIVERLHRPTLLDLQRTLRQGEYHIVHYIGHGAMDRLTGEGRLVFEDEMGGSRLVNGQHLGALMRDHYPLRFMTLSPPTQIPVATDLNALQTVARSLVRRGVAAVVAPQFRVAQPVWLAFCLTLYRELAEWTPVDVAVVRARRAMQEETPDLAWGAPVLFTRRADGCLFDDGRAVQPELPPDFESNLTARLNTLRLRAASPDHLSRRPPDSSSRSRYDDS